MLGLKLDKFLRNKKPGFGLIELLLVGVLIIGMITTILKNVKKKSLSIRDLTNQISEVTQKAFLLSLLENKLYQVRFFFSDDNTITHVSFGKLESKEEARSSDISNSVNKKKLRDPIKLVHFFINGKDELAIKSKELWILFFPSGYSQEVKFTIDHNNVLFDYIMNPFNGFIEDREIEE